MLFEQVAKRVIEIEAHEYTLEADEVEYRASCQSRFNTPEIIAVLGDVVRRLKLLKGTRAAVGRRGFGADLKALANATSADFLEAMNIAGPKESVYSAMSRPGMRRCFNMWLRQGLTQGHDSIPQHTRSRPRYLTLYFSEVSGDIHGPLHFAPDEPVEQIQQ